MVHDVCYLELETGVAPFDVLKLGWEAGEERKVDAHGVGVGCETEEDKPLISFAGSLGKICA